MAETRSHKNAKSKAAGQAGRTEVSLKRNRRLDAASPKRATEVERSGDMPSLRKAVQRLKDSGKAQKVLQVPQSDIPKAIKAMQNVGVSGTVKNMACTKRRSVSKK